MIQFWEAVAEIKARRGVSRGKAEAMLRQACASEVIYSDKQPYMMVGAEPQAQGPPEPIEPREWHEHQIDMMTDKDGCSYWVRVDKADFEYWLNDLEYWLDAPAKPSASPQAQLEALTGQSRLAWEAIKACWPSGLPDCLKIPPIQHRAGKWIKEHHPDADVPGKSTFARVVKLMRSAQTI